MNARTRLVMASMLIAAAALSRLLPHPPNFTPIGAMALFGGAYLADKRLAFIVPLAAMVVSDLFLGFHLLMPVVYACVAAGVWMGFGLRGNVRPVPLALRTVTFSFGFFAVTNFAVWAVGNLYPRSPEGLALCYAAAIPFFRNALLGDAVFSAVLFGGAVLFESRASRRLLRAGM